MKDKEKEDVALRLAASIMGKKGGKIGGARRTEKQIAAHREAARKMNDCDVSARNKASAQKMSAEVRIARAKKANAARNANLHTDPSMSQSRFLELTADKTAQEIADAIGTTYSRVISWRRKTNPVRIGKDFADKIESVFGKK